MTFNYCSERNSAHLWHPWGVDDTVKSVVTCPLHSAPAHTLQIPARANPQPLCCKHLSRCNISVLCFVNCSGKQGRNWTYDNRKVLIVFRKENFMLWVCSCLIISYYRNLTWQSNNVMTLPNKAVKYTRTSLNVWFTWIFLSWSHCPCYYSLWSSGQSSWLQIQRSGFDSRRYQISWEVLGMERGPLSLVSTTDELHGRKSCGSGLENREYGRSFPWPRGIIYPQKLALTSRTSGGRSVGIVRSRTQATEFSFYAV
jgi:hypothetical protein